MAEDRAEAAPLGWEVFLIPPRPITVTSGCDIGEHPRTVHLERWNDGTYRNPANGIIVAGDVFREGMNDTDRRILLRWLAGDHESIVRIALDEWRATENGEGGK